MAYLAKAIIATILILLAFAFGVALYKSINVGGVSLAYSSCFIVSLSAYSSAVLEWTISFGFTLYLFTFFFDLRQSKGVQRGELSAEKFTTRTRRHDDRLTTRQV